jgi:hypothetical protein
MPRIKYKTFNFRPKTQDVIERANEILREYSSQGFDLTLRQLYYQFVARGEIANKQSEYNKLGSIVNDARLAGLIDWNHITDRTRYVRSFPSFDDIPSFVRAVSNSYAIDLLEGQEKHVEVWVEKDALVSVVERACREFTVPFLSCRGYVSQSEMWRAGRRCAAEVESGKDVVILHLGDHDPSGIDMTRDIKERLGDFVYAHTQQEIVVDRIALTMSQIDLYDPPPNPAKLSDSRAEQYIDRYGDESWELDALEPSVIVDLITDNLNDLLDTDLLEERREREAREGEILGEVHRRWDDIVEFLS